MLNALNGTYALWRI